MIWGKTTEEQNADQENQLVKNGREYKFSLRGEPVFLLLPRTLDSGKKAWLSFVWRKFIPYSAHEGALEHGFKRVQVGNGLSDTGWWGYSEWRRDG